jgi:hypothetical protein
LAKTLGAYKGLWQHKVEKEAAPQPLEPQETPPHHEAANQLAHRYRMLVLREHRYKLGRDFLETSSQDPWSLAWESVTSLGRNFRPWAHDRIFALGCYLGIEMSPEVLTQLRHPLFIGRYRRSMFGMWRLLEMLAQKSGQKPVSRFVFRLFYLCPPLGVLIYEKKLQALLRLKACSASVVSSYAGPIGSGVRQ